MARIRTIKPEFWDDEKLAQLPRDARLLFIGMWNFSDDYAVVKGHPVWLKNKIFPYDEIRQQQFNEWLLSLEKMRCIIPFSHNGETYYFIRTFADHQKVDRPSQIRNPEPPENILDENANLFDECSTNARRMLAVVSGKGSVPGREGKGSVPARELFEKFWAAYPKKKSKGDAEKAFNAINPSEQLVETMLSTIERAKTSDDWMKDRGQYIPYPATWLRAKGWEDQETETKEKESRWFGTNSQE